MYRIDHWINEEYSWIIESIDAEYINTSVFNPLSGSTYFEISPTLRNSMKSLINVKNSNNKSFFWCYIRHLNSLKINPERTTIADKNIFNDLDYEGIEFTFSKKDFNNIKKKKNIWINVFCFENKLVYPVYVFYV